MKKDCIRKDNENISDIEFIENIGAESWSRTSDLRITNATNNIFLI